ncbi:hypothetical protein QUF70_17435, partial [Desulfobacterales bacterium HSG17]|nr:hypothetical protein [Desulfobacterales bacterium HSG17]
NPNELKKGWNRRRILEYLNEKDIPCDTGICPEIYLEKAFRDKPFKIAGVDGNYTIDLKKDKIIPRLPNAKTLGETSLSFLIHHTLAEDAIRYTIDQIRTIMGKACK